MQSQRKRSDSEKRNSKEGKKRGSSSFPGVSGVFKKEDEDEDLSVIMMTNLATPKTFEVPNVVVQQEIIEGLNKKLDKAIEDEVSSYRKDSYSETCVGGIELLDLNKNDSLEQLIDNAQLVKLDKAALKTSSFDLVKEAGLERKVIQNTLGTMEVAGQLAYLRESGLIDENWKIVIEIHYIRDRPYTSTKFHKDTLGQTLFVNLNYLNNSDIPGPEYIVNPASTEDYDEYIKGNLPTVFVKDLMGAKDRLGEPTKIGASKIPKNGVVAFVDEAIHHKTPTLTHRTVSGTEVVDELKKNHLDEYNDATQAYDAYKNRGFFYGLYSFSSYLKVIKATNSEAWLKLMTKIENKQLKYDRTDLEHVLPKDEINMLIDQGGSNDFRNASIPIFGSMSVKELGKPPLTRQRSQKLLKGTAPEAEANGAKRAFFRTWVRAVRK